MTKGGETKVLDRIVILGKEHGEAKKIDIGSTYRCGPCLSNEVEDMNPDDSGPKLKKKEKAPRAHTHSPNKRGVPLSPQR